jgi:hypothetical protein
VALTKLNAHPKIKWPPNPAARVKADKTSPTPSAESYRNAILRDVYPLNPQEPDVVTVCLTQAGEQPDVPADVLVKDLSIRKPLFEFLKKHTGKTVAEISAIAVDF